MKAFGFTAPFSPDENNYVEQIERDMPKASGHDILVEIKAVATNPVDTKVRGRAPASVDAPVILGYDAAGIVTEVGENVTRFKKGDEVYYAGLVSRQGSFADYQLVDERIVGFKPKTLSFAQSAAMPLTTITAYELLFERFGVKQNSGAKGNLLVIGGAGGVGSMLIQLASQMTDLNIIATASRPDTLLWCKKLGADHVISHHENMAEQLKALKIGPIDMVAGLTRTDLHYAAMIEMLKPGGKIGVIDDPGQIDVSLMKPKSISFHWEFMFGRPMFQTDDMIEQANLLDEVASLVDAGKVQTTMTKDFGQLNAENLNAGFIYQAGGTAIGKCVLTN
jgi:zinc-binding alcohol dehydrogenase family protein